MLSHRRTSGCQQQHCARGAALRGRGWGWAAGSGCPGCSALAVPYFCILFPLPCEPPCPACSSSHCSPVPGGTEQRQGWSCHLFQRCEAARLPPAWEPRWLRRPISGIWMCGLKSILLVQLSVAHCKSRAGRRSGAMGAAGWREPCFVLFVRRGPKFPLFLSWKEADKAQDGAAWLRCGALPMGGTRFPCLLPSLLSLTTSPSHPQSPSSSWKPPTRGLLLPQHRRDFGSPLLLIGRAARPLCERIMWGGRKAGSPARLAPAPWAQRVTVVGLGARQVTAACLPPPLPPTNHLVIRASCIPAGMGGCHSDGGCWLPSNSHPLAHPPWTNSGHSVLPPRCRLPTLGDVHGVLWSPRWAQWGTAGVRGGFPSCGEWFPRNSLHDGPSTPRRHIDLLPLELWRPPPAWCLAGRWLTQPGT